MNGFELGARLRARHDHQPVAVAAYAPVIPPTGGLAVDTVDRNGRCTVTVTDGHDTLTGTNRDGLDALAALGATMDTPRRPLVAGTPGTLASLLTLARAHREHTAAPVIAWWNDRADYPGTDAVHIITRAAPLRWVLGLTPEAETDPATWADWLGITGDNNTTRLLTLARRIAAGPILPGLLHASTTDTASWERHQTRLHRGHHWWTPDTATDAALGLIGRCHATEWYNSLRLDDPLIATAAAYDGTIVPGTITDTSHSTTTITADRPLSRLRTGTRVTGWAGNPEDAGADTILTGTIESTAVTRDSHLTITITDLPHHHPAQTTNNDRVTLRPAPVNPTMQAHARRLAASGYHRSGNWIGGHGNPIPRRTTVPLDVIIAAADH